MTKTSFFKAWKPLAASLLAASSMLSPIAATAQSLFDGITSIGPTLRDTMNFKLCMQPKTLGACPVICPHPPFAGAGVIYSYRKPVALVEVTCKAGQSNFLLPIGVSKLADLALGTVVQQDCGSMGKQDQGDTRPRYYDVHVFRITPVAMAASGSPATVGAMLCPSPQDLAAAPFGMIAINGLVPVYFSEADPTWKTPLPGMDSLVNTVVASTVGAAGTAAQEGFCFAAGLAAEAGLSPPSYVQTCIGNWGLRDPVVGWTTHKAEPVAAMVAAARAYGKVATLQLVEREIPGLAPIFEYDYPPVHAEFPPLSGMSMSKCYNEGTINPMFYTQRESPLALDPTGTAGGIMSLMALAENPLSAVWGKARKGYFVATYWRDTSCCFPVSCATVPYPIAPFF